MIKGSIQEEDKTTVNIYALNIQAPQYIKQTLTDIKEETDSNTLIIRDFNTPLTSMGRSSRQKINRETLALNDTLDQMGLIDIQNIQSKRSSMHILFKYTWNILQDRSHARPQNKPQ